LALRQEAPRGTSNLAQQRAVTWCDSYKAAPCCDINSTTKGGLQLAATMRTTREGPQHGDPQGGSFEGTQKGRTAARAAAVTERRRQQRRRPLHKEGRLSRWPLCEAGGAQQAAVTERGRPSQATVTGSRHRRPSHEAGGRHSHRRPSPAQCPEAGCLNTAQQGFRIFFLESRASAPTSMGARAPARGACVSAIATN
jgi:hypothetical protein